MLGPPTSRKGETTAKEKASELNLSLRKTGLTRNELDTHTRAHTRRDSAELSATVADETWPTQWAVCVWVGGTPAPYLHTISKTCAHLHTPTHTPARVSRHVALESRGPAVKHRLSLLVCLLESHQLAQERQHVLSLPLVFVTPRSGASRFPRSLPPHSPTDEQTNLTSSHLMNLPPFFSASWTETGLSCSAWTPGLAPAMARDSPPASPDSL